MEVEEISIVEHPAAVVTGHLQHIETVYERSECILYKAEYGGGGRNSMVWLEADKWPKGEERVRRPV